MSAWWSELSDAELQVRLVQRGVDEYTARFLVIHRDEPLPADTIAELLGGD